MQSPSALPCLLTIAALLAAPAAAETPLRLSVKLDAYSVNGAPADGAAVLAALDAAGEREVQICVDSYVRVANLERVLERARARAVGGLLLESRADCP